MLIKQHACVCMCRSWRISIMHRVNRMSQFSIWPRNFATAVHHFSFCQSFASLQNEHPPQKNSNNKQHFASDGEPHFLYRWRPSKKKKKDIWCGQKNCSLNPFYQVVFYLFCCNMLYVVICCSYCSNMSLQYAKEFFNSPPAQLSCFQAFTEKT